MWSKGGEITLTITSSETEMKKTTLRLPVELAKQLKVYCAKKEVSQTEFITMIIEKHMSEIPEKEKT
jgi:predicted DNA-binding protein